MFDRVAGQQRARSTRTQLWPAPSRGWLTSGNITQAPLDAAEQLDNFFPTAQGARLRKGSAKHATLDATPVSFLKWGSGESANFFAATASAIYDITSPADASTPPTETIKALDDGAFSSTQFSTAGGEFLIATNDAADNCVLYFDGTDWNPITSVNIIDLDYDALTGDFVVGETITGGTSGATATLEAVLPSSDTAGTFKVTGVSGTFQDNETLTGGTSAATATSNIPSGTSTASTVAITGVDSKLLSHVWQFKERLFFVEKNTMSAWYLPVDSIGGAASELTFGSVFRKGGSLLFGATWSLDSGAGLDDKCVFVTDQGEVAVYEGANPGSASTWSLVGVYEIGDPLDKNAYLAIGGELVILTDDGVLPLSAALPEDQAALATIALTAPIEDEWRRVIAGRSTGFRVSATLWQSQGFMLIGTPFVYDGKRTAFVANARTGAWCRFTGWDVRCSIVFNDNLYFGSDDNVVYQGETGGKDDGTAYTGTYIPKFSECGTPDFKIANHMNLVTRSGDGVRFGAKAFADYVVGTIPPPAQIIEQDTTSLWGSGSWGSMIWGGGGNKIAKSEWKTVSASGFALSPGVAMTSNQSSEPDVEILATRLRYEVGTPL